MSTAIQGVVEHMSERPAGRGVAYGLKVNGEWFGNGFSKPACSKGDTVKFAWANNAKGYATIEEGTLEVVSDAAPAAPNSAGKAQGNSYDDRQLAISYQAARKDALQFTEILLSVDGVKLPAKGDKLEILEGLVNEMTNQFFEDTKVLGKSTADTAVEVAVGSDD